MAANGKDLTSMSMMDLFRQEAENHSTTLSENLLALEDNPSDQDILSELMRAAHSIKGAARIMDLNAIVTLTRAMEDVFVAAQKEKIVLGTDGIDLLLKGVDMLKGIADLANEEIQGWLADQQGGIDDLEKSYAALAVGEQVVPPVAPEKPAKEGAERHALGKSQAEKLAGNGAGESGGSAPTAISEEKPVQPMRPAREPKRKSAMPDDLSAMSMLDLFRLEAENHCATLSENLLFLEKDTQDAEVLAALMRAAHSIKGAARVIDLHIVVGLAHAMEDVFVAAQDGKITLNQDHIDLLLNGTDMFDEIAGQGDSELEEWFTGNEGRITDLETVYKQIAAGQSVVTSGQAPPDQEPQQQPAEAQAALEPQTEAEPQKAAQPSRQGAREQEAESRPRQKQKKGSEADIKPTDRFLRVSAEGMNRLMGYAGEVQVESRWLPGFAQKILLLKHRQDDVHRLMNIYSGTMTDDTSAEMSRSGFQNMITKMDLCRNLCNEILNEVEEHARRSTEISHHLYHEVLANRMLPFADGIRAFPRMVRDVSRELGKKVDFVIAGEETLVDRDILEKIEAPLNHLIRNAIDHGVETPAERIEKGKPETAVIRLEARHHAGMLSIIVSDDGRGIDLEKLRGKVVDKKMIGEDMASQLREGELLEFIFLPNFSTRDEVSKVSGRGVGLDVVHSAVHEVRGIIRTSTDLGAGTTFELQLPLTLSVMRTLLVEISGEVYAFPLVVIDHVIRVTEPVKEVEGRQYITFNDERIGLVSASQILEKEEGSIPDEDQDELLIVVISDRYNRYGLIVDTFLEIRDLVVQPLDPRLKKVQDISAVSILEDGRPVLIVDVEDMVRSINSLISGNRLRRIGTEELMVERTVKRILVVDDSITVREVERKMLANRGYDVETAVDGLEGWNTIRNGEYDLVVSDIDMPRMDGIELVKNIRQDPRYESIPVIIVSYKDREEDRQRGLEAGADYYLTKGSFQDETLVRTVEELIGTPQRKTQDIS